MASHDALQRQCRVLLVRLLEEVLIEHARHVALVRALDDARALAAVVGVHQRPERQPPWQSLRRQYLYFCNGKASKLSTLRVVGVDRGVRGRRSAERGRGRERE